MRETDYIPTLISSKSNMQFRSSSSERWDWHFWPLLLVFSVIQPRDPLSLEPSLSCELWAVSSELWAVSCELLNRDKRCVWCRRLRDSDETNDKCYVPRNYLSSCVYIYAMCLCTPLFWGTVVCFIAALTALLMRQESISILDVMDQSSNKSSSWLYIPLGSSSQ